MISIENDMNFFQFEETEENGVLEIGTGWNLLVCENNTTGRGKFINLFDLNGVN